MKVSITITDEFGSAQEFAKFADQLRELCEALFRSKAVAQSAKRPEQSERALPAVAPTAEPPVALTKTGKPKQKSRGEKRDERRRERRAKWPVYNPPEIKNHAEFSRCIATRFAKDPEGVRPKLIDALFSRGCGHINQIDKSQYAAFIAELS